MMNLKNLKIGTRLTLGFVLVLTLLVLISGMALRQLSSIQDNLTQITDVNNEQTTAVAEMRNALNRIRADIRDLVLLTDPAEMKAVNESLQKDLASYNEAEAKLVQLYNSQPGTTEKEKSLLAELGRHKEKALPLTLKVGELGLANKSEEATKLLMGEALPANRVWLQTLGGLSELKTQMSRDAGAAAQETYRQARLLTIVLCVVAIALGAGAAYWITHSITHPILKALQVAQTVAAGNLSVAITSDSTDETGQLLDALKEMNDNLAKIVSEVRMSTDSMATGTSEISSGNMDLSRRTEAQASSLQQTAASMEELTATVKQNSETAQQARALAQSATEAATEGGDVVAQVIGTMQHISESSKKISDIIGVIDGIAFQTNILALNAAVEAARAGEQGRGFAVVAGEVRNLAQRSADAAKEIKQLINESVTNVQSGTHLVDAAGVSMTNIVSQVKKVNDLIAEISSASAEQSSGISQVGEAVAQLDQTTQQNAALVEEAASASDSLRQQATNLTQLVSVFKLA